MKEVNLNGRNNNQILVPQARAAMDQFKFEAAQEVGVNLKQGYNGDLTARQAGSIGGQMVKKMIYDYQQRACRWTGTGTKHDSRSEFYKQQNQQ
jgi:small acid-soluble spore protein D (minor alpha/beta-type SASP)